MNREQRRNMAKQMGMRPGERMTLNAIMVQFDNGKAMYLDTSMVQLIDRETRQPLFDEVLDVIGAAPQVDEPPVSQPESAEAYVVAFDTPEGRMEYVKNGNWSGVRPAAK